MKKKLRKSLTINWPDKRVMAEAKALRVAYGLKRTLRYNTKRDFSKHSESVAEHVFTLHFLAPYFLKHENLSRKIDFEYMSNLITFQDIFSNKFSATEGFPAMRRFVEVITRDMLKRQVFWKK